jgi:hypothetical protein
MKKEIENKNLELIYNESKDLLNKQLESYRNHHAKAGTIIGIITLFFPLFLFIIENTSKMIKYLSLIPLILFVWSTYLMIQILRSRLLDQGISPKEYDKLINSDYIQSLLFSIGINRDSFEENQKITEKQNSRFNNGLILLLIGIGISIALLFLNFYLYKPTT